MYEFGQGGSLQNYSYVFEIFKFAANHTHNESQWAVTVYRWTILKKDEFIIFAWQKVTDTASLNYGKQASTNSKRKLCLDVVDLDSIHFCAPHDFLD